MAGTARARRKRAAAGKSGAKVRHSFPDRLSDYPAQQLAEEITALSAIFQDDFNLVSDNPFVEFSIAVRPYPQEDGLLDSDISLQLFVRCLPGYPHKPPKLHIVSEKGHLEEQWQPLHSMLVEQASSIARQGRVMVFNLVEAAQEFLSEHRLQKVVQDDNIQPGGSVLTAAQERWEAQACPGSLQYVLRCEDHVGLDLFGDSWVDPDEHWDECFTPETPRRFTKASEAAKGKPAIEGHVRLIEPLFEAHHLLKFRRLGLIERDSEYLDSARCPVVVEDADTPTQQDAGALEVVAKGKQRDCDSNPPVKVAPLPSVSELLHKICSSLFHMSRHIKQSVRTDRNSTADGTHNCHDDLHPLSTNDTGGQINESALPSLQRDLVLGHLLRLVCGPKGPLPHTLSVLASQLQKLGVMPLWLKDLVTLQPHLFYLVFRRIFINGIDIEGSGRIPDPTRLAVVSFWNASPELLGEGNTLNSVNSRYLTDFEEHSLLGRGGFGHVVLCVNKLDGRRYAIKKIPLKDKNMLVNNRILREVATLSRLQHHNVVRYYQAWFETGISAETLSSGSDEFETTEPSPTGKDADNNKPGRHPWEDKDAESEVTTLYIQMEYCRRTLRQVLDLSMSHFDKEGIWRMFRQILDGLVHIHGQGIIHRDLTPNNIFFDCRNDIKIGDFGLAKFTSLDQPDRDPNSCLFTEVTGSSLEGTGLVGTYFYTAPEIEQGWPHIDEKADMYSLGVVLFELWYPFGTSMERYIVLNDLKQKGALPSSWATEFVQQCGLVQWLMAPDPSHRPSAVQVLRSEFLPPRMEDEALNDILRTIQGGEDSSVYDQVVAAIFDDERLAAEAERLNSEPTKSKRRNSVSLSMIKAVTVQERVVEHVRDVFVCHGGQHLKSAYMRAVTDGSDIYNRKAVKLVESSGTMLHLPYEMRTCFARWLAATQQTSLKRYEISRVARRGVGHSAPAEYYQGDFDIIGGARTLPEAEAIKVTVEVVSKWPSMESCVIHVNHRALLTAIWDWAGVKQEEHRVVAQILAVTSGSEPRSSARKALWSHVRRQLQALQLKTVTVDRLQTVERRLTGTANEALARLRGALPPNVQTLAAIDELATLLTYLQVWGIERDLTIDALMAPSEDFFDGIFFQVYMKKAVVPGAISRGALSSTCVAFGGRYDTLIRRFWPILSAPGYIPGAVGVSIAVQKIIWFAAAESKTEPSADVLVCSRGGGGLLHERMKLAAELWAGGIRAEYVLSVAPSLTEQYEYAREQGIRSLVIVTEAGLSLAGTVKVRHFDSRAEVAVPREDVVKYMTDLPLNRTKRGVSRHLS